MGQQSLHAAITKELAEFWPKDSLQLAIGLLNIYLLEIYDVGKRVENQIPRNLENRLSALKIAVDFFPDYFASEAAEENTNGDNKFGSADIRVRKIAEIQDSEIDLYKLPNPTGKGASKYYCPFCPYPGNVKAARSNPLRTNSNRSHMKGHLKTKRHPTSVVKAYGRCNEFESKGCL